MSATGTLWKLRAKLIDETDPAASVARDAGEEQERERLDRVAQHLGDHQPQELAQRRAVAESSRNRSRTEEPRMPDDPDPEVERRPDDRADRRRLDPHRVVEQHGPGDDAPVVQDRREGVEEEPPLGDEHLAQGDRGREQDRREQHDPEQLDVQRLLLRVEAWDDQGRARRRDEQEHEARDRHDQDGEGEHRLGEARRRATGPSRAGS